MYTVAVYDVAELHGTVGRGRRLIRNASGISERVRYFLKRRVERCVEAEGHHFERLL